MGSVKVGDVPGRAISILFMQQDDESEWIDANVTGKDQPAAK